MKYISITQYLKIRFASSKPPMRSTIIRWIENGDIPGRQFGKKWFVDIETESRNTGNKLVDEVINS